MSLFVDTKVSSLNDRRQLITTKGSLTAAFEGLSSGFSIDQAQRKADQTTSVNILALDPHDAVQNRFLFTVRNSELTPKNVKPARSCIRNTNFASKTASLTRLTITQQINIAA